MKNFLVFGSNGASSAQFEDEAAAVANAKQQSANGNGKPFYVFQLYGVAQNPVTAIQFTKIEE